MTPHLKEKALKFLYGEGTVLQGHLPEFSDTLERDLFAARRLLWLTVETPEERVRRVVDTVIEETESLEKDMIGATLSYLVSAIMDPSGDGFIQLFADDEKHRVFFELLDRVFVPEDPVWEYVLTDESR